MKYLLLLIPFLKYGKNFLTSFKGIQGSSSIISILQSSFCDVTINLIISLIITFLLLKSIKSKKKFKEFVIDAIFIIYINTLYSLITYIYISPFFKQIVSSPHLVEGSFNLIPFKNINLIFYSPKTFIQVIGNGLLLAPLSFFIFYYKWSKNYVKTFFELLGLITCIEFLQLIQTYIYSMYKINFIRAFDIDDFILNSISVIIGFLVFTIYRKAKSPKKFSKSKAKV